MAFLRMILAAALLAAQTGPAMAVSVPAPVLPAKPREAAMACYWSTAAGMAGAPDQTEVIAEAIWYLIDYLRAEKVPGDSLEQIQAMSGEQFDTVEIFSGNPAALAATCRQTHPRNSAAAITLPADTFDRDAMCMAVASLLSGFAQSEQQDTGRSLLLDPTSALMGRIEARLDDATLAAHGYVGDAAVTGLISSALGKSSLHGNLTGIFRACNTAIPA